MSSTSEIKNLISLLDDTDPEVSVAVQTRIVEKGIAALPALNAAFEKTKSKDLKSTIGSLITRVQTDCAEAELAQWLADGGADPLYGMYCVANYIWLDLKYDKVQAQFNEIAAAVASRIYNKYSALEKVNTINDVLFNIYNFTNNYLLDYDTTGHFINLALAKRTVNSISLLLLYLCFAHKFGIPMKVVVLPNNFILSCDDKFYINPSMNGDIFGLQSLKPYPEIPIKSMVSHDCSDAVMMTYHLARALREVYETENKPALMRQLDSAIRQLADKMEIDYPF
jgi:hypothetical protein